MTKRALVTGGAGFIGSRLTARLVEAGYEVTVLDNFFRGSAASLGPVAGAVRVLEGDVRDRDAVRRVVASTRPDAVYHLAALHYLPHCFRHPEETRAVNVDGTVHLLSALACGGTEAFVLASSAAVYAPSACPHGEDDALAPIDVYGGSKLEAERLLQAGWGRVAARSFALRFFNVYGPGETNPHVVPEIIGQVRRGVGRLELGRLDTLRDYVFVDDVVDALVRCLRPEAGAGFQPLNVGTGTGTSVADLVRTVADLLGRDLEAVSTRGRLRAVDRPVLVADTSRARRALGWRPSVALRQGLAALLEEAGLP